MGYDEAPNGANYRCKKCGLKSKKSNMLEHIETHFHGNIFQCRTCLETFHTSQRLRHHKLYKCFIKQQISEFAVNDLLKEKNENDLTDRKVKESAINDLLKRKNEINLTDRKVKDDFTFKSDILRSVEEYDEMILENMEQIGRSSFRCKECGKVDRKDHILEHIETHFHGNIFQCNNCHKNCPNRARFRHHKRKCLGNFFDQNKDYFVF